MNHIIDFTINFVSVVIVIFLAVGGIVAVGWFMDRMDL